MNYMGNDSVLYSLYHESGFRLEGGGPLPNDKSAMSVFGLDKPNAMMVGLNCMLGY